MKRHNTIQRNLVLEAIRTMKSHVTAEEVFEFIRKNHPHIGKGTIYRNPGILAEEGEIRRVEIPDGPDRFDFTLKDHYHVRCIRCGEVFDVKMDVLSDLMSKVRGPRGMEFLDYDISFKGICPECRTK